MELNPPRAPENKPIITCHFKLSPNEIFAPNIWLRENATMANPIETDIKDFGNDMMKRGCQENANHYREAKKPVFFCNLNTVFTSKILKKIRKNNWQC